MTYSEKTNWLINIHNLVDEVADRKGWETVSFILHEFGAKNIENLNPWRYQEFFNRLNAESLE